MKIKVEINDKPVLEISWVHIIFIGIVGFIGFCVLVAGVLSL